MTVDSYQWYSSSTGGYDGTKIAGQTSDTMQLTGSGYYYCRIEGTEKYTCLLYTSAVSAAS